MKRFGKTGNIINQIQQKLHKFTKFSGNSKEIDQPTKLLTNLILFYQYHTQKRKQALLQDVIV